MVEAHNPAHSGLPEIPNIITFLGEYLGEDSFGGFLLHYENIIFAIFIVIFLSLVIRIATKNRSLVPRGLQNFIELLFEIIDNLMSGALGKHREYLPFVGTLFLYIFTMNMIGLVPGFKSPSSNLNTTVALAITVFLYVQYTGIRRLGIIGYIDHFLGRPRDIISFVLIPLMFPLHILEELIKPVSLSLRLFGNVMGEDSIIGAFVMLGIGALGFIGSPVGVPFQLPFLLLAIITGTIQALIFSILSAIYISLMLPHEEH